MYKSMDDLPNVTWKGQWAVALLVVDSGTARSCRELLLVDWTTPPEPWGGLPKPPIP